MMGIQKSERTDVIEKLEKHQMTLLPAIMGISDAVVCTKPRRWWSRLLGRHRLVGYYIVDSLGPRFIAQDRAAAERIAAAIPGATVSY